MCNFTLLRWFKKTFAHFSMQTQQHAQNLYQINAYRNRWTSRVFFNLKNKIYIISSHAIRLWNRFSHLFVFCCYTKEANTKWIPVMNLYHQCIRNVFHNIHLYIHFPLRAPNLYYVYCRLRIWCCIRGYAAFLEI